MIKLLSRPRPPLVVFLLNVFWCRKADGTDARLGLSGKPNEAKAERLHWCAQPSASLANSHNATLQFLRPFARLSGGCSQAALSVYHELAPRVLAGTLNLSQVSRDGNHPTNRSEQAELSAAWVRVLVKWMRRAATASSPPITSTAVIESAAGQQAAETPHGDSSVGECAARVAAATEGSCYGFSAKLWRPPIVRAEGWHFVVEDRLRAGYTSDRAGGSLEMDIGRLTRSSTAEMFFLRSYENAGRVNISCSGGCRCPAIEHDTQWHQLFSSEAPVTAHLSPAVAASASRWHAAADPIERDPGGSSCRLVLDALSSDRVKFTQLTVRGDDIHVT